MREVLKIHTDKFFRDEKIEDLINYKNQQDIFLWGILIGLVLLVYAIFL